MLMKMFFQASNSVKTIKDSVFLLTNAHMRQFVETSRPNHANVIIFSRILLL